MWERRPAASFFLQIPFRCCEAHGETRELAAGRRSHGCD